MIIVTGPEDRLIFAGEDVTEYQNLNHITDPICNRRNNSICEYVRQYEKPMICAIIGLAYGGGCALALVCDIKIAGEHAKFNHAEITIGILGQPVYFVA